MFRKNADVVGIKTCHATLYHCHLVDGGCDSGQLFILVMICLPLFCRYQAAAFAGCSLASDTFSNGLRQQTSIDLQKRNLRFSCRQLR